jgi:hypothetical protein
MMPKENVRTSEEKKAGIEVGFLERKKCVLFCSFQASNLVMGYCQNTYLPKYVFFFGKNTFSRKDARQVMLIFFLSQPSYVIAKFLMFYITRYMLVRCTGS